MVEEASLKCRLRKVDETKNYFSDETKHNDLMSEKYKKTCKYLNCVEQLLILVSTVTGCVLISAFASLVATHVSITSSDAGIKICEIIAGIKKYKPIIKKEKKKKHNQIVLLAKSKLNVIKALISQALIDSFITHGVQFVLINNALFIYYLCINVLSLY